MGHRCVRKPAVFGRRSERKRRAGVVIGLGNVGQAKSGGAHGHVLRKPGENGRDAGGAARFLGNSSGGGKRRCWTLGELAGNAGQVAGWPGGASCGSGRLAGKPGGPLLVWGALLGRPRGTGGNGNRLSLRPRNASDESKPARLLDFTEQKRKDAFSLPLPQASS